MSAHVRRFAALLVVLATFNLSARETPLKGTAADRLLSLVKERGRMTVIVGVRDDDWRPEGVLAPSEVDQQRARGRQKKRDVATSHSQIEEISGPRLETVPYFIATVNEGALRHILDDDRVASVEEDTELELTLVQSTEIIGATSAHARQPTAYTGTGRIIVIIDNGIDHNHPFLRSRVLHEYAACYSTVAWADPTVFDSVGKPTTVCPNGEPFQAGATATAPHPGRPCVANSTGMPMSNGAHPCHHGTKVAGIAAGSIAAMTPMEVAEAPQGIVGVAPGASIVPIQIAGMACSTSTGSCTIHGRQSNVLYALNHVASTLFNAYGAQIAAVNMSLRFPYYYDSRSACDAAHPVFKNLIADLESKNIAVVIGTGNEGSAQPGKIGLPSCIGNAIAVSSTGDDDTVASYANVADIMDVFSPGGAAFQVPGAGIVTAQNLGCVGCPSYYEDAGTSMAAPHVVGAIALLRQKTSSLPQAPSVRALLGMLIRTGVMVTDSRTGAPSITKPQVDINEALDQPSELPAPTNLAAVAVGSSSVSLTWAAASPSVPRTTYLIRHRTSWNGLWIETGSSTTTSFIHSSVTSGTVLQYEVASTDAAANVSPVTRAFVYTGTYSNDPIAAGSTIIRGAHIGELRKATDAWRAFAGLPYHFPSAWSPATGPVLASHFADIVTALNDARDVAGMPRFDYLGLLAPLAGGTIDHRHVQQLRAATRKNR